MSKESNVVKFPQKTEEQKQLDTLNKQFVEIETQSDVIEQQRMRIEELEKAKDYKQVQRELTELNADGDD
tara:strand:- start:138 stop:347 length:210 start_codon:yes stop_codon:yes gene_type:complete